MPMNGAGVTSWPPNTTAIPNTTIESGKYNAFLADLLSIMNTPRPITMGGTGASSAVSGNDALHTSSSVIASAATTDLAAATGVSVTVSGAAAITAFGVLPSGVLRFLTFSGAATLTHNAATLILPGAANIVAAAGDTAVAQSLGGGNWRIRSYQKASGQLVANTLVQPALTLEQSAAPVPTAEGRIQWDTDDDLIAIGDGAATRLFLPIPAATVAGDIEYFTATKVKARLAKGTALQLLRMNAGATAPEWAVALLQKAFESTQQTITAGGALTLAHGLGVQPKNYLAVLQCITANGGYSIGDEVLINPSSNEAGSNFGLSIVPDPTNMNIRYGQGFQINRKDTGNFINVVSANWRLVVRAWV